MVSFAIIVFREVLEVSLVLGLLLAGTHSIAGRNKWIYSGLFAGAFGSVGLAYLLQSYTDRLEGEFEETFSACLLILGAFFIAFTLVWMSRSSKNLRVKLTQIGTSVSAGVLPCSAIAIAIALTVLRDGVEIVLLSYAFVSAGQDWVSLATGGAIGMLGGGLIGTAVYYGLLRSATRYLFTVTNILLTALAAGMISQAVSKLTAVNILPRWFDPLWDSSWIIPDTSSFGELLHLLVGYSSRPSGLELLSYILTVLLIVIAARSTSSRNSVRTVERSVRTV